MCGICGIVDFSGREIPPRLLAEMTAVLRHRGPDDTGTFHSPHAGLGHARLSIIDLSEQGHQPMRSDDGTMAIAYNGEIYNFLELRQELQAAGIPFHSQSDTEVALKAFQHWGFATLARFSGMFALAIWDERLQQLCLARDRFGIKPLYYHHTGGTIVFGSEVKALLASGRIDRRINPQAFHEYLYYGAALGENSMFDGVHKLLPGHYATFDAHGLRVRPYASIHDVPVVSETADAAAGSVRHLLEQSVRRHLISDVPVGVFLSGGVDSSAVTAFASRHYAGRLQTFSVDYDFNEGPSELPKARLVATTFGTDHHEMRITSENITSIIERLVSCHDEPFGDAANIPLYLLAEKIRDTVKVVLQGDGGDEIFGGYRRHAILAWERPWRLLARASAPLAPLLPRTAASRRQQRFMAALRHPDPAMRMALLLTDETLEFSPLRIITPGARQLLAATDPFLRYRQLHARLAGLDPVQRMMHVDCAIILPDIYLEKVDKATMAHGVEVRVPFLDNALAAYAMGLPSSLKVRFGLRKWILKRALRGVVPNEVLDAPKKGFGVPYSRWLRGPLRVYMESVLLDPRTTATGFLDRDTLRRAISEHADGTRDNGFLLWKVLHLQLWADTYGVRMDAPRGTQ